MSQQFLQNYPRNSGLGTTPAAAADIINANFTELYAGSGGGGGSALYNKSVSANPTTGPLNDYAPTGWAATKNRLLLMAAGGGSTINGLSATGFADGTSILIVNTSSTDNLLFNNQNGGSLAANRFFNANGGTIALVPQASSLVVLVTSLGWCFT